MARSQCCTVSEAAMYNNMVASLLPSAAGRRQVSRSMSRCGPSVAVASVVTLQTRARDSFQSERGSSDQKHVAQKTKYFDDQANTLKSLDKETWYKDIDERLKIPMPSGEVTYYLEPFNWRNSWK
ncbi:hypothetical protein C356_04739 [Cryptococcus neoformans c45]|nr:hypothetical protein C356_04739 [Cryptococcus neoformans var. grubii c45]